MHSPACWLENSRAGFGGTCLVRRRLCLDGTCKVRELIQVRSRITFQSQISIAGSSASTNVTVVLEATTDRVGSRKANDGWDVLSALCKGK